MQVTIIHLFNSRNNSLYYQKNFHLIQELVQLKQILFENLYGEIVRKENEKINFGLKYLLQIKLSEASVYNKKFVLLMTSR